MKIKSAIIALGLAMIFTGCSQQNNVSSHDQNSSAMNESSEVVDKNSTDNSSDEILEVSLDEDNPVPDIDSSLDESDNEVIELEREFSSLNEYKAYLNDNNNNSVLQYPSSNENFEYYVYEDYIKITKYIGKDKNVVFPSQIDGLPVLIVDNYPSSDGSCVIDFDKTPVSSIVFEPGIEVIGDGAFACQGEGLDDRDKYSGILQSVQFPEGLEYIGDSAFFNCGGFAEIKLPESLIAIGEYAFYDAFIENSDAKVVVPEKVVGIGEEAFCSGLHGSLSEITILNRNTELNGNIINDKSRGNSITVHGYVGSTAAQLAADTHQKFEVIQ